VSTGYNVLVLLHLLCVIGGFGGLGYNGLYLLLSRRRPGASAVLDTNRTVSTLAELLVYAAFVLGMAAIGASRSEWKFSQTWVWLAFALFFVLVGLLHGLIRPRQRRYATLTTQLSASAGSAGTGAPAALGQLESLEKGIALGWGLFNVGVIAVVYLMVFKPGG